MRVLCVLASPLGERSTSRKLAFELIERLKAGNPEVGVVVRDLTVQPPPHWSSEEISASFTPASDRTERARAVLKRSDEFCDEVLNAQALIIASPMWNFSVPSSLKAWIDHISRVGVSFKYEKAGPMGLLTHLKTVYVIESSGGSYLDYPALPMNHVGPYLNHVFQFLGAKRVVTLTLPGTAADVEESMRRGRSQLESLFK